MKAGEDVAGIESIAVKAHPYLLKKDSNGLFKK